VAIVWPCALSVDAYASFGKNVEVPRPDCPGCSAAMIFWSGYTRPVRVLGICVRLFVRRARCRACAVTHALLPAFVLGKRLDAVEAVGEAIEAVLERRSGVRPVARALGVPHTTVRGWLRRLAERACKLFCVRGF
jgi:transposase-like protein